MTHFCLILKRGFLWVLDGGSHRGRPWYYSSDAGVVKISKVFRAGTIQTHDKNRASNFFSLYPFYMSSHDCPANSMGPYLQANNAFRPVERRSRADFGFSVFFFPSLKTLCLSFFLRCSFQHLFYQVGFKSSPFSPPIFLKHRHPYAGCISILSGSRDHQKQIAFQPWKWKDRWLFSLYLHCDFKNPQTLKFENSMEKFPQALITFIAEFPDFLSSFRDDRISVCCKHLP